MKERLRFSDGSVNYGNGVWGPTTLDLQRADLIFANQEPKTKEDPNNDLLFVSQESVVGKILQAMSKVKLPARFAIPSSMATVLLMSACSGGENKNTQELENKESSDYELPFPKGETWFLTGGPHTDGLSNGVRYAIDIAPPEVAKCPTDGSRVVIDNRVVAASASGQVIVAGDDKNRSDPSHSMVKVKDTKGLTEVYIHLANTKVRKGDKVSQGASLGNPSCEYPPGGRNEGAHIHVGLEKDGQAIPIDGVVVEGWTIRSLPENYDGIMTKPEEKTRTADVRRCKTDTDCGGIRNDLPNNLPNKAAIASPKDPNSQISGSVNEKSVSIAEKPVEKGWNRFTSAKLQIDYPSSWTKDSSDEDTYIFLTLNSKNGNAELSIDAKDLEPEYSSLDSFKKHVVLQWFGDDRKAYREIPQVIGGQKAWKLEMEANPEYVYVVTVTKDRGWLILLSAEEADDWKTIQTMLASVKFLEPTPTTRLKETPIRKESEKWQTFKSPVLPYEVQYPASWKAESSDVPERLSNYFHDRDNQSDSLFSLGVYTVPVDPKTTLDNYVNDYIDSYRKSWKSVLSDEQALTVTIKKRLTAGFNSQIVEIAIPPNKIDKSGSSFTSIFFIEPHSDRSKGLWLISYNYSPTVSKPDRESVLNHFLDSFKLTPTTQVTSEKQAENNWTRFKSFDLPYQIDYPSNWRVAENVVSVEFYDKLFVIANEVNPTKFKVDSEPVANWITIEDYKNQLTQSIKHDAIIHTANALVTETPNQTIAGQKAWKLESYVTSSVATPYHSVVYLTIRDGKAWTVLFAADESEFYENLPTFEKMLASFKFLK